MLELIDFGVDGCWGWWMLGLMGVGIDGCWVDEWVKQTQDFVSNAGNIRNATTRMYFNKKRNLFPNQTE